MPRKEFKAQISGASEESSVEVFDYGNDSVMIVSREFANLIDPVGSGRAPVSKIVSYLASKPAGMKFAVKKS